MPYREYEGATLDDLQKEIADLKRENKRLEGKKRNERQRFWSRLLFWGTLFVVLVGLLTGFSVFLHSFIKERNAWIEKKRSEAFEGAKKWQNKYNMPGMVFCAYEPQDNGTVRCDIKRETERPLLIECNRGFCFIP